MHLGAFCLYRLPFSSTSSSSFTDHCNQQIIEPALLNFARSENKNMNIVDHHHSPTIRPPTMSRKPISVILLSLLFIFQSPLTTSLPTTDSDPKSAYEILSSYNFPVGLLPKGITKYDLDRTTGKFHAYLDGTCSFALEGSYQLKYRSTISGYISNNRLTSLTGVSVKVLFLWLNIVEVVRNGDDIEFSVGIAAASFPIDNFYVCPQCGCGLDCVNGGQAKQGHVLSVSGMASLSQGCISVE